MIPKLFSRLRVKSHSLRSGESTVFRYACHIQSSRDIQLMQYIIQVAIGNGALEEGQGKALVDESLKQGVQFFVYKFC